jgi:hypothetical protein
MNANDDSHDPVIVSRTAGLDGCLPYDAVVSGLSVLLVTLFCQLALFAGAVIMWVRISQPPPFRWQMVQKVMPLTVLDFLVCCCLMVSMWLGLMTAKRVLRRRYNLPVKMQGDLQPSDVSPHDRT